MDILYVNTVVTSGMSSFLSRQRTVFNSHRCIFKSFPSATKSSPKRLSRLINPMNSFPAIQQHANSARGVSVLAFVSVFVFPIPDERALNEFLKSTRTSFIHLQTTQLHLGNTPNVQSFFNRVFFSIIVLCLMFLYRLYSSVSLYFIGFLSPPPHHSGRG